MRTTTEKQLLKEVVRRLSKSQRAELDALMTSDHEHIRRASKMAVNVIQMLAGQMYLEIVRELQQTK